MIFNVVAVVFYILGHTYGEPMEKLDLLFIMASHEKMQEVELFVEKQYISDIVNKMELGDCAARVALMNYGDSARVEWDFSSDIARNAMEFNGKLRNISAVGGTQKNLAPVLNMAVDKIFNSRHNRVSTPDLTIMFVSTASKSIKGLKKASTSLRKSSRVLVIPVTTEVNDGEVKIIGDATYPVEAFDAILAEIKDRALMGECHECSPGYIDLDVDYSETLTGYIVKRKLKSSKVNFEDVLKPDEALEITVNKKVLIRGEDPFYVPRVCLHTQFVKTIKITGLDENDQGVGKKTVDVNGDGSAMTDTCVSNPTSMAEMQALRIAFVAIDGHTEKIKIQDLYVSACSR